MFYDKYCCCLNYVLNFDWYDSLIIVCLWLTDNLAMQVVVQKQINVVVIIWSGRLFT